ncbi:bifunctional UDP-N-acetylglucosamine diphosphorylase/glucosamine-1-phosphate N-acetyltransferase GlmU [Burkholderia sp. L27(2015)]|uniref:bifunctional UDP-N-acetylglucosamine diphosphorylase/glucosamine-1-phosphate N-acetyltransferase GlmU n=1 Tax=Burkholderia sp. L27(2015) TaxID=1641858 RepID=UPI00131C1A56|nr:bifunctional UDP-N-acetylglucosamine diphosphorylase/glucosamine-1-phosphate N-acetyltransferase GlmU [Burkholderia sp. L27(2015)]
MNIVILAAGAGKRMRSALPKVLHPVAGLPLLSHVIETARSLKPARIVVVIGHGAQAVRERVAAHDIQFATQDRQLGTGHAVQQALPLLDPKVPTMVLYGDVPLTRASTLQRLAEAAGGSRYAILTVALGDPTGYGRIVRDTNGHVTRIVEQKDASPSELEIDEVNTGIIVTPTGKLTGWLASLKNDNAQGEFYLTDVVERALADGVEIVTSAPDAVWETLGVNSKSQLAELERIHQGNIAQELLVAGVTLADPARIDVRGTLECGRDVTIDVNCVFEGRVVLGDEVTVGPNCVLRDVTVGAGTRIDAFSHLEQASIGASAVIGPYARLRPGAKLSDGVHIGNFVEVKNATLGAGSKANHLAYVGDSDVGARVNIGAGTITCNYDGANKHRTIIEDDVFIGSDTQLVAPVRVGRGVTIAAGTTVWKDVPADTLVLNEKTQIAKSGYVRPVKKKAG